MNAAAPDVTLVMPAYDEEAAIGATVGGLLGSFAAAGIRLELIVVDNGSRDRTGAIVAELAAADARVVPVRVAVNCGYGHGIRAGLARATSAWVGWINADGQVAPADVVRIAATALAATAPALLKVRRTTREDGWQRRLVSVLFNQFANALFLGLRSADVNGSPKLVPRAWLTQRPLGSEDWFIDAELLIAAKRHGLPMIEVPVAGLARGGGRSHVRFAALAEFVGNLLRARFSSGRSRR
ncbi:MAG: glycosyltransferase family 2 protein [Myxococcales bacterium]|nr:glycosyltransferase family 2 protein [Myxococcales bacterium]